MASPSSPPSATPSPETPGYHPSRQPPELRPKPITQRTSPVTQARPECLRRIMSRCSATSARGVAAGGSSYDGMGDAVRRERDQHAVIILCRVDRYVASNDVGENELCRTQEGITVTSATASLYDERVPFFEGHAVQLSVGEPRWAFISGALNRHTVRKAGTTAL